MKPIVDTSEVLGVVETPDGPCEVCASVQALFDEPSNRMELKLEAFLRPAGFLKKERHFSADWLPKNETITEQVSREECHDVSREVFHRWVRKIRDSAPSLHHV